VPVTVMNSQLTDLSQAADLTGVPLPLPPWPRNAYDPEMLRPMLKDRLKSVVAKLISENAGRRWLCPGCSAFQPLPQSRRSSQTKWWTRTGTKWPMRICF
jgi:hypothetical protein